MIEGFHIFLGTVLPTVLGFLIGKYRNYKEAKEEEKKEYEIIKYGLQSLLRFTMLQAYDDHLHKGYATTAEKGSFDAMHSAYAGLGKNGVMDTVYKEFMALPEVKQDA